MNNCAQHSKKVAGISDMKTLAGMIGNLHYETLTELIGALAEKISLDGHKDEDNNRKKLAEQLYNVAGYLSKASIHLSWAWEISKPFMKNNIESDEMIEESKELSIDEELQEKFWRLIFSDKKYHSETITELSKKCAAIAQQHTNVKLSELEKLISSLEKYKEGESLRQEISKLKEKIN